jgi:hypothetical protein
VNATCAYGKLSSNAKKLAQSFVAVSFKPEYRRTKCEDQDAIPPRIAFVFFASFAEFLSVVCVRISYLGKENSPKGNTYKNFAVSVWEEE